MNGYEALMREKDIFYYYSSYNNANTWGKGKLGNDPPGAIGGIIYY